MKKLISSGLLIILLIIVANFSKQSDETQSEQSINFRGTLVPIYGSSYAIDNISISGLTSNIRVYAKPSSGEMDPEANATIFNLKKINSITRNIKQDAPNILKYKNREYIEIIINWKNSGKKNDAYLIERSRHILCCEKIPARPKKEIAFEAIQRLVITGHAYIESTDKCNMGPSKEEMQKIYNEKVEPIIQNLIKEANNIQGSNVKDSILNLVRKLKNTLKELIN